MSFIIDPKSLSFSSIKGDLETYVKSRPDAAKWAGFFSSLTGQTIVELIAALGAYTSYNNIVGRRENYLHHAENKSSVIGIVEALGYSIYRGRAEYVKLTVLPTGTVTPLPRFSAVGQVLDQDLVLIGHLVNGVLVQEDVPATSGQSVELIVAIGTLSTETKTIDTPSIASFRYSIANSSEDIRVLLNGEEVETSDRIIDLDSGKFAVLSNVLGSVDIMYLNRDSYVGNTNPIRYKSGDTLALETITLKAITYKARQIRFFYGDIVSSSTYSALMPVETAAEAKVNGPLFHETQSLVRGRLDFLKIFRFADTSFVSTNQRDISSALIELVYLKDDYRALTTSEKDSLISSVFKSVLMGIAPPVISDPVRAPLLLDITVSLLNTSGNTAANIREILAKRENILEGEFNLSSLESDIEGLSYVRTARISLGSTSWEAASVSNTPSGSRLITGKYERGHHISPVTPNGYLYEMSKLIRKTGGTEPTWPKTSNVNGRVADGDIVWEERYIDLSNTGVVTWSSGAEFDLRESVAPILPNGRYYVAVDFINSSFGNDEVQKISFTAVPTSGTWRIHYDTEKTSDLLFNATASDVENALNSLSGLSSVSVSGSYSSGFLITFTGADGNKSQPQIEVSDAGLDDIQLISFLDTYGNPAVPNDYPPPVSGSYSWALSSDGNATDPMAFDATSADIAVALSALMGSAVEVTGSYSLGFSITMSGGTVAKNLQPLLTPALMASSGVDEVQRITFGAVPTTGTWRLHFASEYTGDMLPTASAITVASELNALAGLEGVDVTGDYTSGFEVTFSGSSGKTNQLMLSSSFGGQVSSQTIYFSIVPDYGTWRLEYGSDETIDLMFNSSLSDIKSAIELVVPTTVTVTGNYSRGINIAFDGMSSRNALTCLDAGRNDVQVLTFDAVPRGGSFLLGLNGAYTPQISYQATSSILKEELDALLGVSSTVVTGSFTQGFTVTFDKSPKETLNVLSTLVNQGTHETTDITINNDSSFFDGIGGGKYFFISDTATDYYVWYKVTDSSVNPGGQTDPNASNRTGIQVSILTTDIAYQIAIKTAAALRNYFTAPVPSTETLTATCSQMGTVLSDMDAGTAGITIDVTLIGSLPATAITQQHTTGRYPASNLSRTDNPLVITIEQVQEGLYPANNTDAAITITQTTQGVPPMSNLQANNSSIEIRVTKVVDGCPPASNVTASSVPVDLTVSTLVDALSAEPIWPIVIGGRIYDGSVIWMALEVVGTPATWRPSTSYSVGDSIFPTETVTNAAGDILMYQCVGFVGTTGIDTPIFPTNLNNTVDDGNIRWRARKSDVDPISLGYNEYYKITETITTV